MTPGSKKSSKTGPRKGGSKASKRGRGRPGSRTGLSRDRILAEAAKLADARGIEELSMRSLAQQLGVEAMSLYNHVANKDDVLDGMVEHVVAQIVLPDPDGDWRTEMHLRAQSAHAELLAHPWAGMLMVSRANVGPAMLRYVDATIGCLVEAGFSYPMADYAWNAMDCHIYGFTLQKLNFPFQPDEYAKAAAQYLPMIPTDEYPYLNRMTTLVASREHDGVQSFEFGLNFILDGLQELLDTGQAELPRLPSY